MPIKTFLTALLVLGSAHAQVLPGLPSLPQLPPIPGLPSSPSGTQPQLPSLPSVGDVVAPILGETGGTPSTEDKGQEKPDYSPIQNVFSFPDTRLETLPKGKLPYLSVHTLTDLKTYQQNAETCRKERQAGRTPDASQCPTYEWQVPYSLANQSQEVARDLRRAWQRFEDRYYWRAATALNNPATWLTRCVLDLNLGLNPQTPTLKTHVPEGVVPAQQASKVPATAPEPGLHLDTYLFFPQVSNRDYCDGLNPDLTIMFVPGVCNYLFGARIFCVEGDTTTLNPLSPRPIYFNMDAAVRRIQDAVQHAHTKYLAEYQTDTVKALVNPQRPLFFPLPWASNVPGQGAVIAPVMNADVGQKQFLQLGKTAKARLGGALGANAPLYYYQWAYNSPTLRVHTLPSRNETLTSLPGIWPLEEFKRLLGVSSLPNQELFGYTTFFQAWQEMKALMLPEDMGAKLARPLLYQATGTNVEWSTGASVVVPAPIPIAPYSSLGLPYAGPQMLYDWVSVPEGYTIPRVQGRPAFTYAPLLR